LHQSRLFSGDKDNRIVDVDDAVARAFLEVKCYKHGARSMETIISMSLLDGSNSRACLRGICWMCMWTRTSS